MSSRARELQASGGASGSAPQPSAPDRKVRQCTVDVRLQQLEDESIASQIQRDNLQSKLTDCQSHCSTLIDKIERLTRDLDTQKSLTRKYKSEARKCDTRQALREAQELVKQKEAELEEAWNQCTITERELRRMDAQRKRALEEMAGELEKTKHEAQHQQQLGEKRKAEMRAEINRLEQENQELKIAARASQGFSGVTRDTQSRDATRKQNTRMRASLTKFLEDELQGGAAGGLAKAMMTSFFIENPLMLQEIVTDLEIFEHAERETVRAIEEQWSMDICAAMFVHGELTFAAYQALINIMSKTYNLEKDEFEPICLPYGTEMPKFKSKNRLHVHLLEIAQEFGIKPMANGQAASVDVRKVLDSRLRAIKRRHDMYELPMPAHVKVQLAADAATWRKRPSNPLMKNFTTFVVKVMMDIPRGSADGPADDLGARVAARTGDAINSMHNNRLALLYAGKESHSLLQQFFSTAHPNVPSILSQLGELSRDGITIDGHHISIMWKGGGDLKFQSEQLGLNGHASNHPCTHCECKKEHLHLSKDDLAARHGITHRTIHGARMMQHKYGEEWGLLEPYSCPGCGRHISAEQQHLPETEVQKKNWPRLHKGHYYDKLPILPLDFWDFIPDLLHALLRAVANMFFVTVSMNIRDEGRAKELCQIIQEELQVATDPVFNQGTRDSTVKKLQSLNGEESWRILRDISKILLQLFPEESTPYQRCKAVWDGWTDLYAVLLIDDIPEASWETLAAIIDSKAQVWHQAFLQVTGPQDVTPFMHEVVVHFGDFVRLVGPLTPFSSEGVEAKHQPIKRLGKHRTNRRGVGAAATSASNTDIMQTMRRDCASEHIKQLVPKGKGEKKKKGTDGQDPLCRTLKRLQLPVLVQLGQLEASEAAAQLEQLDNEEREQELEGM